MKALILNHFWREHTDPLELTARDNTIKLLGDVDCPIYTRSITDQSMLKALKDKKIYNEPCRWDEGDCILFNLGSFIEQHSVDKIFIAGLHFNYCVMELGYYIRGAIDNIPNLTFQDTCKVFVIKECTIAFNEKLHQPVELTPYNYGMKKQDVDPWLCSMSEFLNA
jgi:hypothetical protein